MAPMDWVMVVFWVLIFVVTLYVELQTGDIITIWFSLSAIIALVCGLIFATPIWQIVIFVGSSLTLVLLTFPLTKNFMRKDLVHTNADRLVGKIGTITKEVLPNEIGEIRVESSFWRAINDENLTFTVGEKVIVDAIVGNKLIISKLSGNNDIERI